MTRPKPKKSEEKYLHPLVEDVLRCIDSEVTLDAPALRSRVDALGTSDTHGANLIALASAVLASAHELDGSAPYAGARALVEQVHGTLRDRLHPDILALVSEVRDTIALEAGRRAFVVRVREALQAVEGLDTGVLDVQEDRLLVGGDLVLIAYDRPNGERRTRAASIANAEGRLLLCTAAGRGPLRGFVDGVLVSRLHTGLASANGGHGLRLVGDPVRLEPPLRLTERARAAAAGVRAIRRQRGA